MVLNGPAVGLIIASIILVLILVFMILIVILVRQCLAFLAKRNHIQAQMEQRERQRENHQQRRRGSVTVPVVANFDWHHTIKIAGTPPPSYTEAKTLPSFEEGMQEREKEEDKMVISKDEEANEEGTTTSRSPLTTASAATGQTTTTSNGHKGGTASGNVTLQIDVENNSGDESRTFSTGYTEYGRASS